ncbi:hypothetical protein [Flavobacterium hydrophilum]|uniref:Uncharacterized protein n=1 Tax=Flavobacterium hydrophilum TaxID=2211445 RepID=A0A2V4BY48_9FLAO|nr:hypothetical protein [Flavobacterium hydrophilum]PXY43936.1 hypothetical protein DMB68_15940 [Flavobacterium hydrophilum]
MKKIIYALILPLVVVSGLLFTFALFANGSDINREIKNETSKKSIQKNLSAAERKAALKKWEATPDGIMYKKWEASPAGKKVYASEDKIRKSIRDYTNMEGVVTSLSLPSGSRLGFGVIVRINGDDYILSFASVKSDNYFLNFNKEAQQLLSLKVNDKIIIRSHSVSHAPKYAYPILSGDYVERDSKIIYKRAPRKGGC